MFLFVRYKEEFKAKKKLSPDSLPNSRLRVGCRDSLLTSPDSGRSAVREESGREASGKSRRGKSPGRRVGSSSGEIIGSGVKDGWEYPTFGPETGLHMSLSDKQVTSLYVKLNLEVGAQNTKSS